MKGNLDVVYERCCGIDVHKETISCYLITGSDQVQEKKFGTLTRELQEMATWLKSEGCQMVAMESTGSYWKPLYNIFELEGMESMVVNAQHLKTIGDIKTDKHDARRIAKLLRIGILKPSLIPGRQQREYRELVRYRRSRVEERSREINRLQKMLEGANIKLSNVVSDVMGVSAQTLLDMAINGEELTTENVEKARNKRCKSGAEEFLDALTGIITPLQRELFAQVLRTIREQTVQIERIEALIESHTPEEYDKAAKALEKIPGIGRQSADQIIGEIGIDMSRFPSSAHLSAWGGVAPGTNESAGRRKKCKAQHGNKHLKKTLSQCAVSAKRNKDSFFYAQYQRLVVRLGKSKANLAVAHSILIAVYHVLSGKKFVDLGSNYYNQFNKEKKIKAHLKQLKKLGWEPENPVKAA